MTLDLSKLLLFGILCASLHWLIARAEVTKPLWSRATGYVDKLLRCAGCFGWWLGGPLYVLGMRPFDLTGWWNVLVASILGAFITPVFEGALMWGLERSAVHEDEPDEDVPPPTALFTGIDHEAAHGLAHDIADELWGEDVAEERVDELTDVLVRVMGSPDEDDEDVTPTDKPS